MLSQRGPKPSSDDSACEPARPVEALKPGAALLAEESAPGLPPSRRRAIFAVVSVGLLMSSIDMTIVATALPTIDRDLHAPINWAAWTITIYALGRVLVFPLVGRLSDQYGRRAIFLCAIALFTAGSLCCSLAGDIYLLVALRGVQAVGGAAFIPSATGIVADHFGSGRDRAVGLFTSILPVGAIIGPIAGGLFVTYWSWRGIFLVNVPIGTALLLAGHRYLPRGQRRASGQARPDLIGMAELAIGLLAGMLGIAYLGSAGASVSSPLFLAAEAIAVTALTMFVRHTARVPAPFIPSRLLRGNGFGVMNLLNFLFGATALGFSALVPLYATERYGIASLDAGTLLTARALGVIAVGGLATLALRRTGYRLPMLAGYLATAAGLFAMAVSPLALSPYAWLGIAAAAAGAGMGMSNPASSNATLQLAPRQAAAISGLRGTFRQAGAITAISVTTAILARSGNPGIMQAHVFAVLALILLATTPLIALVPEHRGTW